MTVLEGWYEFVDGKREQVQGWYKVKIPESFKLFEKDMGPIGIQIGILHLDDPTSRYGKVCDKSRLEVFFKLRPSKYNNFLSRLEELE